MFTSIKLCCHYDKVYTEDNYTQDSQYELVGVSKQSIYRLFNDI